VGTTDEMLSKPPLMSKLEGGGFVGGALETANHRGYGGPCIEGAEGREGATLVAALQARQQGKRAEPRCYNLIQYFQKCLEEDYDGEGGRCRVV